MHPNREAEIVRIFQRSFKEDNDDEIASVSFEELREVNAMLGDRDVNEGYRIKIQDRIKGLELREQRKYESKIRAGIYIMGIITGLIVAGLSLLLFG